MSKGKEPISFPGKGKRKEKEETAGNQSCKRKRLTEVLKAPKPSPVKADSCNPFHNRTQDRTIERENCTVLHLGNSKDREWGAKATQVGHLNTYCARKRPRTGWSTKLSNLKKIIRDATLRLWQRSQLTNPPLNWLIWPTTRSSNRDVERNPGPGKKWLCTLCSLQIKTKSQTSIRCNHTTTHWVHLTCTNITATQYTNTWKCSQHLNTHNSNPTSTLQK